MKQVAYKAESALLEGDVFVFGPFEDVDQAQAHFTHQALQGKLDEGTFQPFYLNSGDDPVTWIEVSRRPQTDAPRLFPVSIIDQEVNL